MEKETRTISEDIKKLNEDRWINKIAPIILDDLRKKDERVWKFLYENTIKPFKNKYSSTYIHGPAGTGKTIKATWLMLQISKDRTINGSIRNKGLFINTVELLQEIKRSFNSKDINEDDIIEKYKTIDILVLDDFGLDSMSEWVYKILYIIINWRYSHFKTTIYTSNNSLEDIANSLQDDRIIRRIYADCQDSIYKFE